MNIEQGLFKFDFTDHHAILGVALDADTKQIRKRYLKIARKLHPDALRTATDAEKQQASELLSKMVNPAYEKLTQDKEMAEYQLTLRMRGKSLSQQPPAALALQSEAAKAVLASNNALSLYTNDLNKLASAQYESLEQVFEITGQISELNLAYLVSSAGNTAGNTAVADSVPEVAKPNGAAPSPKTPPAPPPPSPKQQRESIIDSYLNRARQFELKKDYPQAILEMREAVKAHPNSAPCHAQLASIYLRAGQATMARVHMKRALALDPNDMAAKGVELRLNKGDKGKSESSQRDKKKPNAGSRGGLFGLFGGKQK